MKVLIIQPSSRFYGGAEQVIVRLCQYMQKNNIYHGLHMAEMTDEMRRDLKGTEILSGGDFYFKRFDIINYHNFPSTLISTLALPVNKPGVWYCNEPAEMFTNWKRKPLEAFNRWLVRNQIKNVAVADNFNADRCESIYKVKPRIIPYGIDYNFFSQCNHDPDPNYFTVMQVGTISRYKNQLATIRAVAEVRPKIKNVRLWLIGNVSELDYKKELENEISRLMLGGCVTWEPHVTREHLRSLYAKTDVLMHPVKEQGGWLSPFEAISAGVPVIVSPELTCHQTIYENGLGDVSKFLAGSINSAFLYQGVDVFEQNQVRAQHWVRDNLTWDKFGAEMVKYFQEIVKRN